MDKAVIETPLGLAVIEGDQFGISRLYIGQEKLVPTAQIPDPLQSAVYQIREYFRGSRKCFDLKLQPKGSGFQKKVWNHLQKIPFGRTCSYLELSKDFGNPKAIRAIAAANGKNPLWILIPCHRIIGRDGSLTGYAGGLWRKKWLLEHEQSAKQQILQL